MSQLSPRIGLPFLAPSQAQKHVTHNEALQRLDAVTQLCLEGFSDTTPPALPAEGDIHGLGAGATGAWAGHDGELAYWDGSAWLFLPPQEGWRGWGRTEQALRIWHDGAWQGVTDGIDRLGVNTAADGVNRLAVASEASLLSHDGAGHQLKLNKATSGDTASLLFQSGWTGHAEMGLAGQNGWSLKVSPDGSAWTTALQADAASGILDGAAVQQTAADVTPGRLMRADYGYGPGNLLGTVAQSGGLPTGAVIERGGNANGDYVRFADGMQICTFATTTGSVTAHGSGTAGDPYRSASLTWTFPAAFTGTPIISGTAALPAAVSANNGRRSLSVSPSTSIYSSVAYSIFITRHGSDANPDVPELWLTATGRWD